MAATDIQAEILGWALDEANKQAFGEDFGVAAAVWPAAQGPVWHVILTCRAPLLGQGPNFHIHPVGTGRPDEAAVREATGDGLRKLRELGRQQLSAGNGRQQAGVAG